MNWYIERFLEENPQRIGIILEIKEGHDKEDTIIQIGIAKATSLKGRVRRFQRNREPIIDLIELSTISRKQLRGRILN